MRFIENARALGTAALSVIGPLLPHFKDVTTSRGLNYHYYFSAPDPGKPTLLLVHGFPSFAVDWHPQINYFKEKGFGIVAADQLGYGGTDKPEDSAAYVHSLLAKDMVDILDHENGFEDRQSVGKSTFGSLPWVWFLDVWVLRPTQLGIDPGRTARTALLGYETFGYWEFFTAPDGPQVLQDHIESFLDLGYARDARLWRFNFAPTGAIRIFVESDTRTPRITAITEDQWEFHHEQFSKFTLDQPLNYYRINLNGEAQRDDDNVPTENYTINKPVFFGGAHGDVVCVDWAQEAATRQYSPNLTVANFNTTHWVAADAPKQVNEALEKWINEVVVA
ncbi:hypothetical protein NMY22_g4766 [Coprinellus aureogranulatus]|nr:hypothetical protein NMY22_g4766 [Coprinellus aureogranulatus]